MNEPSCQANHRESGPSVHTNGGVNVLHELMGPTTTLSDVLQVAFIPP